MERVNLKKLAKELNLSVSTVSKALNDSYEISTETKEKVMELAKNLRYQPNPFASSLRKQKSKTIALVIPEIANSFFSMVINGIEHVAQEKDYHVLIYLTHESYEKEVAVVGHLINGRVDGVIISVSSETRDVSHLRNLYDSGIPVLFFDRVADEIATTRITTDDYESGYKATEHLIQQNCQQIAYLCISSALSIAQKRMDGYKQALKDYGLGKGMSERFVNCTSNSSENYTIIHRLLSSPNRPDALFASVEKLAVSGYYAARDLNLLIPEQLKIISFSNLETAPLLHPPLTTITQPAFEMGEKAAQILVSALSRNQKELENEQVVLQSRLVIRGSTASA